MGRYCHAPILSLTFFIPDDIPDAETSDPTEVAVLSAYASEQALYHYIRWLIHRPGLALPQSDPQFASSLQISSDAAAGLLRTIDVYKQTIPFIQANPAAHPCTIFITCLTPLYRTFLLKAMPATIPMLGYSAEAGIESVKQALRVLGSTSHDHADVVRRRVLQKLLTVVFGDDHVERKYLLTSDLGK